MITKLYNNGTVEHNNRNGMNSDDIYTCIECIE